MEQAAVSNILIKYRMSEITNLLSIHKYWPLRNVIANQALEGQIMTVDECERCLKIFYGELSVDGAIAEIHQELAADKVANPHHYE